MKAIMISIRPEWTLKILNKEKILEVRTTCPKEWKDYLSGKTKIKPQPMKGYIYCTKGVYHSITAIMPYIANGKVVAEYTINEIEVIKSIREKRNGSSYQYHELNDRILKQSCLTEEQILDYTNGNDLYAWHIDNLKIYDKPKELSEFSTTLHRMKGKQTRYTFHLLQRPPQSWCYVKELEEV